MEETPTCHDPTLRTSLQNFVISDVLESDIFPDLSTNTFKSKKDVSIGVYVKSLGLIEITKNKGSAWRTIGGNFGSKLYLFPEEALFLFECNKLVINGELEQLSSQAVWSTLCPNKHAFNQYLVYAQLKRMGFVVVRHGAWKTHPNIYHAQITMQEKHRESDECVVLSKRVKLDGEARGIKSHFPSPSYDVYRPGDYFMKSALLQPDYSVAVVASSQPFPSKEIMLQLKRNQNLLIALVTETSASFYSFSCGLQSILTSKS